MVEKDLNVVVKGLVYGDVKVCGLIIFEYVNNVFVVGVSYGGFIFVGKFFCYVMLEMVFIIVNEVFGYYVGVFVDKFIDEVVVIVI